MKIRASSPRLNSFILYRFWKVCKLIVFGLIYNIFQIIWAHQFFLTGGGGGARPPFGPGAGRTGLGGMVLVGSGGIVLDSSKPILIYTVVYSTLVYLWWAAWFCP